MDPVAEPVKEDDTDKNMRNKSLDKSRKAPRPISRDKCAARGEAIVSLCHSLAAQHKTQQGSYNNNKSNF